MNYEQAVAYIHGTQRFGSKPGLLRIQGLLEALGNPHKKLKFVHVAGTNGKGSVCAMTASALQKAGYKTGLYISPYVEDFRERVQINREMIPKEKLVELVSIIDNTIKSIVKAGGYQPTEFEIITALAMLHFLEENCDIVVLEVGLGGRFDATNVIDAPIVAAITSISSDHTKILGSDIEDIAFEKCGIIKQGCMVVTSYSQNEKALAIIRNTCEKYNVPLSIPDTCELFLRDSGLDGSYFTYKGHELRISLPGIHQVQNAATALEIICALRKRGFNIDDNAVKDGLASAKWNGRFEIIRQKPLCITDGAHNAHGVEVLCSAIDSLLPNKRIIGVLAMMNDKDHAFCVPSIAKKCDVLITVQVDWEKACPADKLAGAALSFCENISSFETVEEGVKEALSLAGEDDVILACGSLYMIGEAKRIFLNH